MRRLISADVFRLRRSRIFWICMAAVFLLCVLDIWDAWDYMRKYGYEQELADRMFAPLPYSGIVIAVFCGVFLGGEFSSGMIRNKLAAGHTRMSVYLSALCTCLLAGLFLSLSYAAAVFVIGMPLLGTFKVELPVVAYYAFCMLCVICVLSAVMVLLVMRCANRTTGVVLGMLLMLGMLYVSAYIDSRLSEPKMNAVYTRIDSETYRPLEVEEMPNPLYLKGTKREIYQWLSDILPMGQSIQISNLDGDFPLRWPFASAAVFVLVTGAGICLFKRKDLN